MNNPWIAPKSKIDQLVVDHVAHAIEKCGIGKPTSQPPGFAVPTMEQIQALNMIAKDKRRQSLVAFFAIGFALLIVALWAAGNILVFFHQIFTGTINSPSASLLFSIGFFGLAPWVFPLLEILDRQADFVSFLTEPADLDEMEKVIVKDNIRVFREVSSETKKMGRPICNLDVFLALRKGGKDDV